MTTETTTQTTTTTDDGVGIHSRALLVDLTIHMWSAQKLDKRITEEINQLHNAGREAGRYKKNLLGGKQPEYRRITRAWSQLRRTFREMTLPWDDGGVRLLPNAQYFEFTQQIRRDVEEFDEAVAAFVDVIPEMKARARTLLNGMYRESDYPTDIAGRFGVDLSYLPVPSRGDFRVDLPADELMRVEESVDRRVERAIAEATRDAWNRLYEMVGNIRDRFAKSLEERDEDERAYNVRQGLIDDARALVDLLGRLNVTDDPDLEAMRAAVAEDLAGYDADALRDDDETRRATVDRAQEIMDQMRDLYGGPEEED